MTVIDMLNMDCMDYMRGSSCIACHDLAGLFFN